MEITLTPIFVKPKRAAELLDCSERTIRTLAAEGTLEKVRIGRMVRYRLSDIASLSATRASSKVKE